MFSTSPKSSPLSSSLIHTFKITSNFHFHECLVSIDPQALILSAIHLTRCTVLTSFCFFHAPKSSILGKSLFLCFIIFFNGFSWFSLIHIFSTGPQASFLGFTLLSWPSVMLTDLWSSALIHNCSPLGKNLLCLFTSSILLLISSVLSWHLIISPVPYTLSWLQNTSLLCNLQLSVLVQSSILVLCLIVWSHIFSTSPQGSCLQSSFLIPTFLSMSQVFTSGHQSSALVKIFYSFLQFSPINTTAQICFLTQTLHQWNVLVDPYHTMTISYKLCLCLISKPSWTYMCCNLLSLLVVM